MKKIIVIGSMNMDCVVSVQKMPAVGETVLSDRFERVPGGKGANQAYALGKLGGNVSMLGAIGEDDDGRALANSLASVGVDTSRLKRIPDAHTGTAFIYVDSTGDNSIVVVQGANKTVDIPYVDANMDLLESCDLVLLQLEIPLEAVVYAAKKAKALGKTVVLDPAPARTDLPPELYACVDYLKPNEVELGMLLENLDAENSLEGSATALQKKGVRNVVVTLGEKGAFLQEESGAATLLPADSSVRAVDTTAAGDGFTAALAYGLASGMTTRQAMDFAVGVSNLVVTRKGAQTSIPSMDEVVQFMAAHGKTVVVN